MVIATMETVVQEWAKMLAPEWLIEFERDPMEAAQWGEADPSESNAITTLTGHYNKATMWFDAKRLKDASVLDANITAVHEILHLVFRDHRHLVNHLLPDIGTTQPVIDGMYDAIEERTIDRLARAIVLLAGVRKT